MTGKDVQRLKELADLMLNHRLALLREAAAAKARSEAALAALAQPASDPDGLEGAAAALASLAYQRWTDARRAEINPLLARQTHHWMEARDDAKRAFGKAEALRGLADKLAAERRR